MTEPTIYVVDEAITKPGRARDFVERYLAEYAPAAAQRGMTLDRVLVSPPIWLTDDVNTVTITWTLPGVGAWWNMTAIGRNDATLGEWWTEIGELLESRTRTMRAAADDVDRLSDL